MHAGPPHIFPVKHEAGYPKLWCLLCGTVAEVTHCRGRKHLGKLWEKPEEDAKNQVVWQAKYKWLGPDAEEYWTKRFAWQWREPA
eukprot:2826315-Lingulodinium_polyedra.AAC.1